MSIISEQVQALRDVAMVYKGTGIELILNDAANTIEELSAKLANANMDRSTQYYNDGWIPCSERLPEIAGHEVLATLENTVGQRRVTVIFTGYGLSPFWYCNHKEFDLNHWKVVAWKELPEPYKPKGE